MTLAEQRLIDQALLVACHVRELRRRGYCPSRLELSLVFAADAVLELLKRRRAKKRRRARRKP